MAFMKITQQIYFTVRVTRLVATILVVLMIECAMFITLAVNLC